MKSGAQHAEVTKDQPVESHARIPYRWITESKALLRALFVKVPKPKEETKGVKRRPGFIVHSFFQIRFLQIRISHHSPIVAGYIVS